MCVTVTVSVSVSSTAIVYMRACVRACVLQCMHAGYNNTMGSAQTSRNAIYRKVICSRYNFPENETVLR